MLLATAYNYCEIPQPNLRQIMGFDHFKVYFRSGSKRNESERKRAVVCKRQQRCGSGAVGWESAPGGSGRGPDRCGRRSGEATAFPSSPGRALQAATATPHPPSDHQGGRDVDRQQELDQVRARADGTRVSRPRRRRSEPRRVELQRSITPRESKHTITMHGYGMTNNGNWEC